MKTDPPIRVELERQLAAHQSLIIKENTEVSKTLTEWTPALLSRLFDAECSPEEAINRICSLHRASLAAEREKVNTNWPQVLLTEIAENKQLRDQLAEDKSVFANQKRAIEEQGQTILELKRQLAAAKAAIKLIKARCENTNPTRHAFEDILEWCKGDTTALDAAIDTARKPLVDALHRLAMRVLQSDFYLQAKDETDDALALAKVKEVSK